MTPTTGTLPTGHVLFSRYAFPPNELGYCGPPEASLDELATSAAAFDGAWPYLLALAASAGLDPLDEQVVRNYWIGGPLLSGVDPRQLLERLRAAFTGQVTGMLGDIDEAGAAHPLAHHSFHVFVVYPWVRFLERDPATPLRVLQACRIRWGTVTSVEDEHVTMVARPLVYGAGELALGDPGEERVRWRRDGASLAPPPDPGVEVAAHWDWICGPLSRDETRALAAATQTTLDLVNAGRVLGPASHH